MTSCLKTCLTISMKRNVCSTAFLLYSREAKTCNMQDMFLRKCGVFFFVCFFNQEGIQQIRARILKDSKNPLRAPNLA